MRPLLDFHRQFPGIELTVVDRPVSALREAVLQGQVDFVLLYAPLPEKQFRSVPLLKERVLLAVPGDSPLAQPFGGTQPVPYPQISFARLEGVPFIKLQAGRVMAGSYNSHKLIRLWCFCVFWRENYGEGYFTPHVHQGDGGSGRDPGRQRERLFLGQRP